MHMMKIGRIVNGGLRQCVIKMQHRSMQKAIRLFPECNINQKKA